MRMQIVISKTFFFTFFQCPQWCLIFLIMSYSEQLFKKKTLQWMLYFIKENCWMSASDEAKIKKVVGGSKSSSKFTLKTKWCNNCGCCDDSGSCEQLKKCVTDKYFEKNLILWTLMTFHNRKWMLQLQCLSEWCLMAYMFDRNFKGKTSQIEWLFSYTAL